MGSRVKPDDITVHFYPSVKTFENLAERMGVPPSPPPHIGPALPRIRRLVGLDPGGAWIADHGGRLSARHSQLCARDYGAVAARGDPDHQSAGPDRVAAGAVARHGDGDVRSRVILASPDARAQASSRILEGLRFGVAGC